MNNTAIEIDSLNQVYPVREGPLVKGIDDLSLSVPAGQVFGLLGANGAGKTTLVKLMGGMIKPVSGRIRLNGYDMTRASEQKLARQQIGIALEGTQSLRQGCSVRENLTGCGQTPNSGEADPRWAEQLLHELDLDRWLNSPVHELPSSIQRKIVIACALIADTPIVVLDEPTSGLDMQAAQAVKVLLKKLAHKQGKTIVLTTRQPELAQELCDQTAILNNGRLVASHLIPNRLESNRLTHYQIKVKGHLSDRWARGWFDGLTISRVANGETIISGEIKDQAALRGVLNGVRDLALPLLSVSQVEFSPAEMKI